MSARETGLYYLQSRYYNPTWGRFLNADAFVSTGQGLLGNNMFAYCLNNPSNYHDPSGNICLQSCCGEINLLMRDVTDFSSGGCVTSNGGTISPNPRLKKMREFVENTSEVTAYENLEQYGFAYYNDTLIIRLPGKNGIGFSFGFIALDHYYSANEYGINTLKHEYGHKLHMEEVGVLSYSITVAAPSLTGAAMSNAGLLGVHYYSLPWEYIADQYGGVNRTGYEPWANDIAVYYWVFSILYSQCLGGEMMKKRGHIIGVISVGLAIFFVVICIWLLTFSRRAYPFPQSIEQIKSIDIMQKGEFDEIDKAQILYTLDPLQHEELVHKISNSSGRFMNPPPEHYGVYIIRVTYADGGILLIGEMNSTYHTAEGKTKWYYYTFNEPGVFHELVATYIERPST